MIVIDTLEMKEKFESLLEGLECDPEFWSKASANQLRFLGSMISTQAKRSPGMFVNSDISKAIEVID